MTTATPILLDWEDNFDALLRLIEPAVLNNSGKLQADVAEKVALERYETYGAPPAPGDGGRERGGA